MGIWTQALAVNNNDAMFNLTAKSLAEVATTPNSYNHSFGNTNTVKVNSNGASECGTHFQFGNLEIGDIAELFAEFRVISGDTPVVMFGEYDITNALQKSSLKKYAKPIIGEWQTVKLKAVVNTPFNVPNHRAMFGLEAGKVGVYEIRSASCTVNGKAIQPQDKTDLGFYKYVIKKTTGVWNLESGANSSGTMTNQYATSIVLVHTAKYKPTCQVSVNNNRATLGFAHNQSNQLVLNLRYIKDDLSISNSFADLPDGTEIHVTIFYKV